MLMKNQSNYSTKSKYFLTIGLFVFISSLISFKYCSNPILPLKISTNTTCRPFKVNDTRPFFERDYPQLNLPRQLSDLSYKNVTNQLRSLRLIVLSCARDIEKAVDTFRTHIEPILNLFHSSSSIHILESDSRDKTVEKLHQWSRVKVYTIKRLSRQYRQRTDRLAYCRNTLLNKAHTLSPDYILFVDSDIFATNISSFLSNFKYNRDDWSVMTAATTAEYYDIWALRTLSDSIMNYDVWKRAENITSLPEHYCPDSVSRQIIGIHAKHIPVERGLIEVRSAFGGAALYRANATYGCQYDGKGPICEHVPFHLCIGKRNQGRIFINPQFYIHP